MPTPPSIYFVLRYHDRYDFVNDIHTQRKNQPERSDRLDWLVGALFIFLLLPKLRDFSER